MISLDLILNFFFTLLLLLLVVAFMTLLERKVLGLSQSRKGPLKVGLWGLLQPFADGLKLFSKEEGALYLNLKWLFLVAPCLSFVVNLVVWISLGSLFGYLDFSLSALFFLCCASLSVYGVVFSGWASNSKYALLGGLRAVAQTISYELVLSFLFFIFAFVFFSYSFSFILSFNFVFFMVVFFFVSVVLVVSCVAETNRAPFDLAEGESELVSGFNVEYGGLKFSLIFLAEYAAILWMCFLCTMIFLSVYLLPLGVCLMVFLFFFLRSSYPRIRYDILMLLMWKVFMLIILFFYLFVVFSF